jgi:hypothetical protein
LHEKLQAKMSRVPQGRLIKAVLSGMASVFCVLSFLDSADAAEDFKKLNSAQIRRSFAAMEFTDQVHWAERYAADGTLTTREMGTTRVGTWHVEDDQPCVDLGKEGGRGCYDFRQQGQVENARIVCLSGPRRIAKADEKPIPRRKD